MNDPSLSGFIESWGSMGALLGFNPSTVRVHALLIARDEPLSLDAIAEALQISRGNASMCLKELRSWNVVRRTSKPGDRRGYYESEPDVWKMALAIVRERKRREFDPALAGVRKALALIDSADAGVAEERMRQLEEFLTTLDDFGKSVLDNESTALSLLEVIRATLAGPRR